MSDLSPDLKRVTEGPCVPRGFMRPQHDCITVFLQSMQSYKTRQHDLPRYKLVLAATHARPLCATKHKRHLASCVPCASKPEREATLAVMPSLMHPPKHLLSEIGRRSVPAQVTRSGPDNGIDHKLAMFACGMTGTPAEVSDPQPCSIEGSFPMWLSGNLYRNGPGTFDVETKDGKVLSLAHWYTGLLCPLRAANIRGTPNATLPIDVAGSTA